MSGSRSRSRSPLFSPSETPSKKAGADSAESLYDESNNDDISRLVVLNFPLHWEFETLKNFLLTHCQSVVEENELPHVIRRKTTKVILRFKSSIPCFICYKKLCDVEIEGKKLKIEPIKIVPRENISAKGDLKKKPMYQSSRPKFLTMTTYTSNPNETYGLSLSFLSSLGIKPPLKNNVYVGNLSPKVDKEKLTEVFSLAGRVVNIIMLAINRVTDKLSAKVEYDHAVEAVQAISMFNRQCLMGLPMYVHFDLHKYTITMPIGLQSLGPGLGANGEPLRDIRQLVEIQPMKEQLSKELAELKAAKTQASSALMNANTTSALGSLQNIMTPLNINTMGINPLNPAASVFGLNVPGQQGIHSWQGLLQQNIGNDLASTLAALQAHSNTTGTTAASALAVLQAHSNTSSKASASTLSALQVHNNTSGHATPLQVHNNTSGHTNAGFGQALSVGQTNENLRTSSTNNGSSESKFHSETQFKSQSQSKSKYADDQKDDKDRNLLTSSDMLVFNHLPSSVTVQALNNKMSEIGELMFAEITGKGRAIVRFRNNQDAERCIKLFDRSKVDGQTIEVKFF